jgi:hypothetical protein
VLSSLHHFSLLRVPEFSALTSRSPNSLLSTFHFLPCSPE